MCGKIGAQREESPAIHSLKARATWLYFRECDRISGMLMVIFGAGASYDSYSSAPPPAGVVDYEERPPLANQLFSSRGNFRNIAAKYPKCLPLIAQLEPRSNGKHSVEEFLEEYQAQADAEGRSQLYAIRYYLQEVIRFCEIQWIATTRGVSNYSSLFNQARRLGDICFVTFNYDVLLEQSLAQFDVTFPTLESYVNEKNCKLIKPHGSTDWTFWFPKRSTKMLEDNPTPQELIRAAPVIGSAALLRKMSVIPGEATHEIFFQVPALAIPVVSKSEFVCPNLHLDALRELLPHVTHIAAIGWRAGEKHFLAMLSEYLQKSVAVTAVCGNQNESSEILERIRAAGVFGSFESLPDTFTDFVRRNGIESFLAGSSV